MRSPIRRTLRPEDARRSNLALVLQAILVEDHLSRADIARSTGLTKVTVSDLVAELIADDLVRESGPSEGNRPGKRGTLLTVNPSGRDIVALDVSAPDTIRGAIVSLTGCPLASWGRESLSIAEICGRPSKTMPMPPTTRLSSGARTAAP